MGNCNDMFLLFFNAKCEEFRQNGITEIDKSDLKNMYETFKVINKQFYHLPITLDEDFLLDMFNL